MIIVIVTLLLAASVAVVLFPLVARRPAIERNDELAEEMIQRLRQARDRVYEEIRALQQERFLNHLSVPEYQVQLSQARTRAALLLKEQEQMQQILTTAEQAVQEEVNQLLEGLSREVETPQAR